MRKFNKEYLKFKKVASWARQTLGEETYKKLKWKDYKWLKEMYKDYNK